MTAQLHCRQELPCRVCYDRNDNLATAITHLCHSSHVRIKQVCCVGVVHECKRPYTHCHYCCSDLDDLANADGDVDEHKDDPMSHMDIEGYIVEQLRTLHSSDRAGFESLCSVLNASQLQTIQSLLT